VGKGILLAQQAKVQWYTRFKTEHKRISLRPYPTMEMVYIVQMLRAGCPGSGECVLISIVL